MLEVRHTHCTAIDLLHTHTPHTHTQWTHAHLVVVRVGGQGGACHQPQAQHADDDQRVARGRGRDVRPEPRSGRPRSRGTPSQDCHRASGGRLLRTRTGPTACGRGCGCGREARGQRGSAGPRAPTAQGATTSGLAAAPSQRPTPPQGASTALSGGLPLHFGGLRRLEPPTWSGDRRSSGIECWHGSHRDGCWGCSGHHPAPP